MEHDAMEIWSSQYAVMMEVIAQTGVSAGGHRRHRHHQPAGDHHPLGPGNRPAHLQRHRLAVPPDRRTLWTGCWRTAMGTTSGKTTGLVPDAYFSATKIKWILDHVEGARERAERGEILFGTVDSWLLWKLTGGAVHATDVHQRLPHHALRHPQAGLGRHVATRPGYPQGYAAPGTAPPARSTAIPRCKGVKVPIAGIAGDQQAALFGQTCFDPGDAKEYLRHRLLSADEHRGRSPVRARTA